MENYNLLWIDLETTGSDPDFDSIIEIGAIFTDINLNEKFRYTAVIGGEKELDMLDTTSGTVVREMHVNNGLYNALQSGEGSDIFESEHTVIGSMLAEGLIRNKPGQIVLAGSGVGHFDRLFINKHMPTLASYFKYFVIDVGVMRRAFSIVGHPELTLKADKKTHRAMEDIQLHLNEMKFLKEKLDEIYLTYPYASSVKEHNKQFTRGSKEGADYRAGIC